jgi:hypothetical protein
MEEKKATKKIYSVSEKFIDQLYSINADLQNEDGKLIEIPENGFLGLLATGYKGLSLYRKKRGITHLYSKFTKGKKIIKKTK